MPEQTKTGEACSGIGAMKFLPAILGVMLIAGCGSPGHSKTPDSSTTTTETGQPVGCQDWNNQEIPAVPINGEELCSLHIALNWTGSTMIRLASDVGPDNTCSTEVGAAVTTNDDRTFLVHLIDHGQTHDYSLVGTWGRAHIGTEDGVIYPMPAATESTFGGSTLTDRPMSGSFVQYVAVRALAPADTAVTDGHSLLWTMSCHKPFKLTALDRSLGLIMFEGGRMEGEASVTGRLVVLTGPGFTYQREGRIEWNATVAPFLLIQAIGGSWITAEAELTVAGDAGQHSWTINEATALREPLNPGAGNLHLNVLNIGQIESIQGALSCPQAVVELDYDEDLTLAPCPAP